MQAGPAAFYAAIFTSPPLHTAGLPNVDVGTPIMFAREQAVQWVSREGELT